MVIKTKFQCYPWLLWSPMATRNNKALYYNGIRATEKYTFIRAYLLSNLQLKGHHGEFDFLNSSIDVIQVILSTCTTDFYRTAWESIWDMTLAWKYKTRGEAVIIHFGYVDTKLKGQFRNYNGLDQPTDYSMLDLMKFYTNRGISWNALSNLLINVFFNMIPITLVFINVNNVAIYPHFVFD